MAMGVHSVSPYLICKNAVAAIKFYSDAFGATEMMRLPAPDGRIMHACLKLNGASVMLSDEFPDHGVLSPATLGATPVLIHLIVDDADASMAQAENHGATIRLAAHDAFWGDRYGQLTDPFGHLWSISTPGNTKTPEEMQAALAEMSKGTV
ncbi:VOC family protein [Algicella marina]|uniref:VOC family protein n=2 Tax=Algicella marina TaxID=2683284 RepID=A0A6P1T6J0_9RHOB|nr:VOC family protein [Algicella marina]